jgi:NAD(P)-dependent dehydrogenase (short-subunit alcohol dehydrogenase family)
LRRPGLNDWAGASFAAVTDKGAALVTGAGRGIGLEVARALAKEGYRVLWGVRDRARARDVPPAEMELLDVGSPPSIRACADRLLQRGEPLAVLVNNAGVYRSPARVTWDVNVRGPLLLTRALEPLLHAGSRVVMVSSGLGQRSGQDVGLLAQLDAPSTSLEEFEPLCDEAPGGYGATKAALNVLAQLFARAWKARGILVNAVSPGWVRTEMGGAGAPRSVAQGAASVLWACRLPPGGPSGGFFQDGEPLPW